MVPFHMLGMRGFLLVFYSNFVPKRRPFSDIQLQNSNDLENRVMHGPLEVIENVTIRQRAYDFIFILTMDLSRVASERFNVEKYRDLEIPVNGQSRSLEVVPFERLDVEKTYCMIRKKT